MSRIGGCRASADVRKYGDRRGRAGLPGSAEVCCDVRPRKKPEPSILNQTSRPAVRYGMQGAIASSLPCGEPPCYPGHRSFRLAYRSHRSRTLRFDCVLGWLPLHSIRALHRVVALGESMSSTLCAGRRHDVRRSGLWLDAYSRGLHADVPLAAA